METNEMKTEPVKTPEQIEEEMRQTRVQLSEKVAALEHQVVNTAQTAADTVTNTLNGVKSLLNSAPGSVSESVRQAVSTVKDSFGVTAQVQANPWQSLGIAAGLGFLAGVLTARTSTTTTAAPAFGTTSLPAFAATPVATAPAKPGVFDELTNLLGQKLREVAETALESAAAAVKENVRDEAPHLVNAATSRLVNAAANMPNPAPRNGIHTNRI